MQQILEFVINLDGTVRISVGTVPSGSSLIIKTGRERYDPENECDYYWSTYFGATGREVALGNDVDAAGNMYFTGTTSSNSFPFTPGAFQEMLHADLDAYAASFRQLDEQKWATFFGGSEGPAFGNSEIEQGFAIKWNPQNDKIYFVGSTSAADFPNFQETGYFNNETKGLTAAWHTRGFIVKLKAENGLRDWATFFGDQLKKSDAVTALYIRENGNVVVGGYSFEVNNFETEFPFLPDAPGLVPHVQTEGALYMAEFSTTNHPIWATKLTNELQPFGDIKGVCTLADIAEDDLGNLYAVGHIYNDGEDDFIPMGPNSLDFTGTDSEVFILQFSEDKEIVWSSYLGGNSTDFANSIVCTAGFGFYITGTTFSDDFPVRAMGNTGDLLINDLSLDGPSDIFICNYIKNPQGVNLIYWSRYLGGAGGDQQATLKIARDDAGPGNGTVEIGTNEIAVTGIVQDGFEPLIASSCPYYYDDFNRGESSSGSDAVLVTIKDRRIMFSTYWGGDIAGGMGADNGLAISHGVSTNEKAFVLLGGSTNSRDFGGQGITIPVCQELPFAGSYFRENFLGGNLDAFISKIYYGECLTSDVSSPWDQIWTLEIQPNPATDGILIKLPDPEKDGANILLFDATGNTIMTFPQPFYSGTDQLVSVPIGSLPVGLYYVTLQSEGRTYSGKFVKM